MTPNMTQRQPHQVQDYEMTALITALRQYPPHSVQYKKTLTQIVRQVSPKLWRENTPYYADALQQTWLYFCQNVGHRYDANVASLTTWLNAYLKWRLKDFRDRALQEQFLHRSLEGDSKTGRRAIDLPDRHDTSCSLTLERVCEWVRTDASGELRCTHIQGHPEINCQVLILRRIALETTWRDLSAEFGIAISTLTSFYYRQCLTRLRQFGASEDYL
jgi:hypothetical protein